MRRFKIAIFSILCVALVSVSVIEMWAATQLNLSTYFTIVYTNPVEVLTVYQEINQSDPKWTKEGLNATLDAKATKVESNSLDTLAGYLVDNNGDNNPDGVEYGIDEYDSAPVYRNIDLVNVDIETGEIIGKLSDPEYNFEWYGRSITLPQGTTLASGRTLTQQESFTVDVYTYYPDMYIARYIQDNVQYIRIGETLEEFSKLKDMPEGIIPVYVKGWYTGTFEATIFNADHSVAKNTYGVICRSYIYDSTPITYGSASYLITNYNYNDGTSDSSATVDAIQTNMMLWASNLTRAWKNANLGGDYDKASGVQGENYTAYIYNLLYLVKYANNNSQEIVGYGNTYSYSPYSSASANDFTKADGTALTSKENYYLSQKGGGTIGVYNSGSKNTATYVQNTESGGEYEGDYMLSPTGYDGAGMNYGYTYRDYVDNGKHGLYAPQFLTYTTSSGERKLRDGYVGSDKYTSVFCLGMANPWGNVRTWIFGTAQFGDGTNRYAYINFEDYDYNEGNWLLTTSYVSNGYDTHLETVTNAGYVKVGYNLASNSYNSHCDVDSTNSNSIMSLIGMPSTNATSTSGTSNGLCDYFYATTSQIYIHGFFRGGCADFSDIAGVFYLGGIFLYATGDFYGFRPSLIFL